MAFELKEGQGSLFVNDKGDNENRPDYKGKFILGGNEYKISAWIKNKDVPGKKSFLSLSIQAANNPDKPYIPETKQEYLPF